MANKAGGPVRRRRKIVPEEHWLPPDGELLEPPYQIAAAHMLYVVVELDAGKTRPLVPPELELSPENIGVILTYETRHGWGLPPVSSTVAGAALANADSPDGTEGVFVLAATADGNGYPLLSRLYNTTYQHAVTRHWREGDVEHAACGPTEGEFLHLALRPKGETALQAGVDNYLGHHPDGGISVFSAAYSSPYRIAEVLDLSIGEHAPEGLRACRPRRIVDAYHLSAIDISWGPPRHWGWLEAVSDGALLDMLTQLGHAAILIEADGTAGARNALADRLLGPLPVRMPPRLAQPDGERVGAPFLVQGAAGRALISTPLTLHTPLLGPGMTRLVLLSDPAFQMTRDCRPALELLGLTAAEARLAVLVGSGLSPRDGARSLGISLSTARSALRSIFDKLSISRQSQLAGLVARLAGA